MPRIDYGVHWNDSFAGDIGDDSVAGGLTLRLKAVDQEIAAKVKWLLERTGARVKDVLYLRIPYDRSVDDRGDHTHLRDTIHTSGIMYHPGGAGGGGFYEMEISVGEEGVTPQLGFILYGTHGPIHAGQGNLGFGVSRDRPSALPFTRAQAMPLSTERGTIFRTSVRGQRPQTEWLEAAHAVARSELSKGVRDIGRSR